MATTNNENKVSYITASDGLKYRINDNNAVHDSSEISFSYTGHESFKDPMMTYIAENMSYYAMYVLEDGRYITTEKYEKLEVTGLGTFFISEGTLEFQYTDEEKWKLPMVDYVNENIKFSNLSNNDFKAPMTTYVNANLDFDSMPQRFKDKMIQYFKDNISYILGFDDNTGSILMTDK